MKEDQQSKAQRNQIHRLVIPIHTHNRKIKKKSDMMDIISDSQCFLQYVLFVNTNYIPTRLGMPEQFFGFTVARAIDA